MKMQFSTTLLSLLVAGASALPSSQPQKRTAGAVYICTGANFTESCSYLMYPLYTCVDLPVNLSKAVSAFGPDEGAECSLFQGHCNEEKPYHGEITSPGIADLSTVSFDNLATSFLCLMEL